MPLCCLYPHADISETPAHYTEYEYRICRLGYVLYFFTLSPDLIIPIAGRIWRLHFYMEESGTWWAVVGLSPHTSSFRLSAPLYCELVIKSHEKEPQAKCPTQYVDPQSWDGLGYPG
jgi:hypothetical protein